jgi:uncharacterized membrane-anchored protein
MAVAVGLSVTFAFPPSASAAREPPRSTSSAMAPTPSANAATEEAPSLWQIGPTHLDLGHELALDLPSQYRFLPKEPAPKAPEANGHFQNDGLLALLAGKKLVVAALVGGGAAVKRFFRSEEKGRAGRLSVFDATRASAARVPGR